MALLLVVLELFADTNHIFRPQPTSTVFTENMYDVHDTFTTKVSKMTGNGTGLLRGGNLDEVEAFLEKRSERAVVEGVSIEHIIIYEEVSAQSSSES